MNMVAEGYNASRCMNIINEQIGASMPIAEAIYHILWNGNSAADTFHQVEESLI